jgi:hypothetical protein
MLISIYPKIDGEYREMKVEAELTASGPFDSPPVIVGSFVILPAIGWRSGILSNEVLYEGEVFRFRHLGNDGSFELIKAW